MNIFTFMYYYKKTKSTLLVFQTTPIEIQPLQPLNFMRKGEKSAM